MSYRAVLGVLAVLPFLVLAVLYTASSLEAAGQGQNSQNSRPDFGRTTITLSVTENVAAGVLGAPITATDADSDTLRYRITTTQQGPFEIDPDTGQLRTTEPLNYEAMSTHQTPPYMMTSYYFYVGVSDGKDAQGYGDGSVDDEIAVEVNVKDVEEDGVVDLLWDRPEVGTPIVASLTDADGEVSNLTWQWTSSSSSICSSGDISGATAASYTPQLGDNGKYLCAKASYTDRRDSGKTANAVSANPVQPIPSGNTAPAFTNTSATRSVRENTPSGTHLGDAFQATDADSDEIRYFLGGTDGGAFDIDPKTGQLKVKDPLNHESKETYSLSVFARDPTRAGDTSESTGTVAVTITVTDINERPKVTGDFKPTYRENSEGLLVTTLTGVDEDEDGPFHQNYSVGWLIDGYAGSDGDFFYMDDDGDHGHLKFRVPPDFDNPADRNRDNVYNISMTAYTGEYDRTFFNVNVTVTDGNDDGVVVGPSSVNYPEGATRPVETYTISGTTQQTISWAVTGADRDRFTIVGGVLKFKSPPDYNSPSDLNRNNKYSITVTAYGANVTASKNAVVTVTEHNFAPVISGPATPTFAENGSGTVATYSATDEDTNDTITWDLAGDDGGLFDISSSGELTFDSPPDFESARDAGQDNGYEVTVQANDRTVTVDHGVTVTVTNVNEAPSFGSPMATRTIDENTPTDQDIGAPVEATDVDANDSLTYSLDSDSTAVFDIDSNGQLKTKGALDHETKGSYSVIVTVRDTGSLSATITVTIDVIDVNDAPEFASATDSRTIPENTAGGTNIGDPVEAIDQDGDTLNYTLDGTDAGSFDIVVTTGQLLTKAASDIESKASYSVTVAVRDNKDAAGNPDTADDDTVTVTITVTQENEAPTFATQTSTREVAENTGAGQNIGTPVTATDEDTNDTVTYGLAGADAASFDIVATSGQLQTKADLNHENKDSYTVKVVATDVQGASDDIIVTIGVTDVNEPPTFPATTATRRVDENAATNQDIGVPVAATDVDANDSLTYSWGGGADDASFDIDMSTGQLKTKDALDHEAKDRYSVTVAVRDAAGLTARIEVTIYVGDMNDAPKFLSETTTRSVPENAATDQNIGAVVEAKDEDDGDVVTYRLEGTDPNFFDIDSNGQLKTKGPLDHETTASYLVTVVATDTTGAEGRIDVTITVADVNEAPKFPSSEDGARSIPESATAGTAIGDAVEAEDPDVADTLTYTLGGTDANSFTVVTLTGQLQVKDALDFETKVSYKVTVSVRDSKDGSGNADTDDDDTITVTITVENSNEDIDLSGNTLPSYAENSSRGVATYTAMDPESETIIWNLSGDDAALFDITGGVLTFDSPPDFEDERDVGKDNHYQVTIEASTATDAAAKLPVTITVTDVNEPPEFPAATATREVSENTEANQPVGAPVEASDPDAGDSLTYALGGTHAASFDIDTSTGQLKTKAALDFEGGTTSYSVTVTASDTDPGTADDTIDVTITVTDANDAPTFNSGLTTTISVPENTVAGKNIAVALTATDQDGDMLTYSLNTTSEAVFDIDSNGQLKTKGPLDHETTASYTVTVSVRDSRDAEGTSDTVADDSITVTVNVTDLVEDGTITLSSRQPQVGTAFTATLTDPAITPVNDRWTWEKSTDKALWTVISTATTNAYTPVAEDVGTWLKVTATYNDGQGSDDKSAQAVSEFQVRDQPQGNSAPAFPTEDITRSIVEGTGLDRSVGSPVTANDPDSGDVGKLTYTLSGTNVDSFDIDATTGQIKTAVPLDYDTMSSYTVNVTGTDPSLATDDVTVTITVIQAPAPQSNSGNSGSSNSESQFTKRGPEHRSVPENTASGVSIGQPLTATDAENDTLTYSLGGTDVASLDIDRATGQLKTKDPLDHETKSSYTVTVSVHDGMNAAGGSDTTADDTVTVDITVTDVNEPPGFNGQTATREIAENTVAGRNIGDPVAATDQDAGDTLTYTLGGTDASAFDIDSTGQLTTKVPMDYETKDSYAVTVVVRDSKDVDGNADTLQDDSISVTINVIDLNEVATLTLSSLQPQVGIPLTATLNDPDGASNVTWAWEKSSDKSNWTTISGATSSSYTPVVGDVDFYPRVTAFYTDSNSSDKSAQALSEFAVRAEPSEANTGPDFGAETAARNIVEGSAAGRNIGQPVAATDANAADDGKLNYTLSGTDGSSFHIVASSGQLLTKDPLVYATQSSYTVMVTATDPFRASDTIAVTITVTEYVAPRQTRGSGGGGGGSVPPKSAKPEPEFDANGPVTITVPENTEAGTDIGDPLTATDDDDTVLTYSIIDWRDGSSFDIDSSTGQLKSKAPLDYETRTQYELQAKVHDDDEGDDRITVQVRVTGMPEAPTVTGDTTIQVAENSSGRLATYSATDPEGSDVTWDLSGDDAGDFAIANGGLSFSSTPDHENPADSDGDNVYHVTVEASDGTDSGTLAVTVTVTNLIDDFRVRGSTRGSATGSNAGSDGFGIAMTSLSYPENGTAAVATYVVVELAGAQIGWSLAGDDGDLFSIDNGILSFDDPPDYESPADSDENNAYVVAVQAADGTETASLNVTIKVTDVNEGPTLAGDSAVDYAEQGKGSVATYRATDPEGDDLDWLLSGGDADAFSIEAGVLSFSSAPNFEEPSDSDKDNVYDVIVEVTDSTYSDSADVSVTVTDIQEVPITNPATQAVGTVTIGSETSIKTPDDAASVSFPAGSRANIYMARVDSDPANCSAGSAEGDRPGPNDGDLHVCLAVVIFDTWGNEEQDVTLSQPASVSLMMDADDLGGVEMVQQAYDQGGINIYTRGGINDEWSTVEFTLTTYEEGTVTMTVTGVTQFRVFAAATDADVFNQLIAPGPTPTPTPQRPQTGSGPVSMMSGAGVVRMPPRRSSVPMAVPAAPSTDGIPLDVPPVAQVASVEPLALDVVEKAPLWALIVLIMGSVMVAAGTGMVAYPRLTAPPPWMRVPGAPVKPVKRQAAFKSRV